MLRASGAASTHIGHPSVIPHRARRCRPTQLSSQQKAHSFGSPSHGERNGRATLLFVDRTVYAVVRRPPETLSPAHAGPFFAPLDFLPRERKKPRRRAGLK